MAAAKRIGADVVAEAIAKAVSLAGERVNLSVDRMGRPGFGAEAAQIPWWIAGRFLREGVAFEQAEVFANTVTEAVASELGTKGLMPSVIKIGDDILAGYIDRFDQLEFSEQF